MSDGLDSRQTALDLLHKVLEQKQSFDVLLETDKNFRALDSRDRAFVHMLCATALRRLGQCDDLLLKLQDNPHPHMAPVLKNILRLGITQILWMNVPEHAAVSTSVDLCEARDMPRMKNLTNALLRRLLREKDALLSKQDSIRLNIPGWLLTPLIADWGLGEAGHIGDALLSEAPLDVTIKNPGMLEHWMKELDARHVFFNTLRLQNPSGVTSLSGYEDGHWWVQDAAAALPVQLMGEVEGKLVYDLCAAPGGKTAQLAAKGARVVALDRSAKRLVRLHENMTRLSLTAQVETVTTDAAHWHPQEQADIVLLDAPCSASGVIRRHPDILHLKSEKDLDGLIKTQARIFDHAASLVKPGGVLVYCTCSVLKAEGENQVSAFLEAHPDFSRHAFTPDELAGNDKFINETGEIRLFPNIMDEIGGLDGFFISRLKKEAPAPE
ncbi:MAG: 16S rRNA (cytosine(967)-C(5))-methyltransferase RsmB [Rhodospirillales bacterium]|nr:16S rRNA (cytosine(967)-C(5))-methyltransferase RsmB [Rhodospirillales bacterium]MCB9973676.1 16S rRNA (cytosine(967)-C(5))-methyltransferase RsmB [Rhodospirillales bacterium]